MTINKKLVIPTAVLIIIAITLTAVTAAVLSSQQSIPATGAIQGSGTQTGGSRSNQQQNTITSTLNIAIFTDAAATTSCTNINWGFLNPGDNATKTVYVKNTGNTQAILSMSASGWTPAITSSVLTLSWNKEGSTLAPGATVPATITLHVAQDTGDLSTFSLNIVVSGSGQ